uniref:Uncharacterized protein n=1 Tax=Arundo donax TaxID=35708 RepID=A0A0A8Y400_ARUDO
MSMDAIVFPHAQASRKLHPYAN